MSSRNQEALNLDGAVIKDNVFLNQQFTVIGSVSLVGTKIERDLNFVGASFDKNGNASLIAQSMKVDGIFLFHSLKNPVNKINLNLAHVGQLADDKYSWGVDLELDGFVYGHLAGNAPVDAKTRSEWLKNQSETDHFRPQPWKQLQKVLREMGHNEEARQIAIELEDYLRMNNLIGQGHEDWGPVRKTLYQSVAKGSHWLFGFLMSYGYRPIRLAAFMVGVWLICGAIYWYAALQGVMAPTNPLVFQNLPKYENCKSNWYLCEEMPEAYTGFSPLMYSLDVLLPVVDLKQENDWAPMIPTPKASWPEELFTHWTLKHVVQAFLWFEILFGWISSLMFGAVVSGLSKRSEG